MSEDSFASRRQSQRVKVEIDVDLGAYGEYFLSKLDNVSTGGAFVKTRKLQDVGSEVKLRFKLPGDDQLIEAEGIVIWTYNQAGPIDGNSSGMGIQFTEILQSDRDRIKTFVAQHTNP
ncbi:MAG TPA: TIGR02266 family protein [Oligoflexia bacterium]|nr:TIGR02266 family protein [Oligoflexia bacterium]HMR24842.1 TIGR02266 family protein [Oligoflexia bacterium]